MICRYQVKVGIQKLTSNSHEVKSETDCDTVVGGLTQWHHNPSLIGLRSGFMATRNIQRPVAPTARPDHLINTEVVKEITAMGFPAGTEFIKPPSFWSVVGVCSLIFPYFVREAGVVTEEIS